MVQLGMLESGENSLGTAEHVRTQGRAFVVQLSLLDCRGTAELVSIQGRVFRGVLMWHS